MVKDKAKDLEKPKEEAPKEEKKEKPKRMDKPVEVRNLIRIANTDLNADKSLISGIRGIKGVSYSMAKAVCNVSGFDPATKISALKDVDLAKLEDILRDPLKYGIPIYFINRRKELETGANTHLIGSDLDVAHRFDVQRYVDLRVYRGVRHMLGQPVRGQRTRSSFRQKGRVVGVMKKSIKLEAKPAAGAAAPEKKEEKK